jgi:hypothetical protein
MASLEKNGELLYQLEMLMLAGNISIRTESDVLKRHELPKVKANHLPRPTGLQRSPWMAQIRWKSWGRSIHFLL